ncbi:hypothetical protein [Streptomyces sp. NPDC046887]|uniref:hypothetical protein n=1 Tax=Streptomyces sp. NPDC046887 TaxID=3155472 RepID=UPI0033F3E89A
MTDTTPYDHERDRFSRSALARLVLCDRAVGLADTAAHLAVTRFDAYTGPGGRAGEALTVAQLADRLVVDAVVYERERGSSWEDIARYLDMDSAAAAKRFTPELDRWDTAFAMPYRLDETGRKRLPQLPRAAYDPERACRRLDLWAHLRLSGEDKHAVSAGLRADPPVDDTADPRLHDLGGRIARRNLAPFVGLLLEYIGWYGADETDWDAVAGGLEAAEDEDVDSWSTYSFEGGLAALDIRLARVADGDALSVVVAGAHHPDLRLRIDTLLAAYTDGEFWSRP